MRSVWVFLLALFLLGPAYSEITFSKEALEQTSQILTRLEEINKEQNLIIADLQKSNEEKQILLNEQASLMKSQESSYRSLKAYSTIMSILMIAATSIAIYEGVK